MKEKKKKFKNPLYKLLENYSKKLLYYTFTYQYMREPINEKELEEYSIKILELMK